MQQKTPLPLIHLPNIRISFGVFLFFPSDKHFPRRIWKITKRKNSLLISEPDQGGPYAWAIQIKKSTHQREKQGWYLFHHQAFFGNSADRLFYTPFISLDGRCLIRLMDKRCQTRVKYCKFILILRISTTIHPDPPLIIHQMRTIFNLNQFESDAWCVFFQYFSSVLQ